MLRDQRNEGRSDFVIGGEIKLAGTDPSVPSYTIKSASPAFQIYTQGLCTDDGWRLGPFGTPNNRKLVHVIGSFVS